MCVSKENDGLGFKKLRSFNLFMLAKQGWRLVNNVNPLVTKLMQARYYPNSDFLNAQVARIRAMSRGVLWRHKGWLSRDVDVVLVMV